MTSYILFAVAIVILLIVIARQPEEFRVERSKTLSAPASAVFPLVNDFRNWTKWSPWENIDPSLKRDYSGAPAGVGAVYDWSGNGKAGAGRMTILESKPGESIVLRLEFFKPFKAVNKTEFVFTADGAETHLRWTMTGKNNFMSKAFHLFMNMDKMVGGDFEKGLAGLEKAAQSAA